MQNIALVVAYDGTNYHGFQAQKPELATIQSVLEAAIAKLTGYCPRLTGAGRTDAGVHAAGQVVNFRSPARIPLARWPYALNSVLPSDIVVQTALAVPDDFHARYHAKWKTYRYTLDTGDIPDVFQRRYSWHTGPRLNLEAMQQAAHLLVGYHDFVNFCAAAKSRHTTWRRVMSLEIAAVAMQTTITVTADGFLYHMVRIIAGTLVEVARNKMSIAQVDELLSGAVSTHMAQAAPAQGLCLMQVAYDLDIPALKG